MANPFSARLPDTETRALFLANRVRPFRQLLVFKASASPQQTRLWQAKPLACVRVIRRAWLVADPDSPLRVGYEKRL
jgi:hypothetical protein